MFLKVGILHMTLSPLLLQLSALVLLLTAVCTVYPPVLNVINMSKFSDFVQDVKNAPSQAREYFHQHSSTGAPSTVYPGNAPNQQPPPLPAQPPIPQRTVPAPAMASPPGDYPRPDFVRNALHWESLNGPWDFLYDDDDAGALYSWQTSGLPSHAPSGQGKPNGKRTIQVPFVFQSPASGINEQSVHQVLWYERQIEDLRNSEEKSEGWRLLLRFGAVDYHAKVWLDGHFVGEHTGGHVPFDLDLTDALSMSAKSPNRLTVRVFDSAYDLAQPRGKQYWGPE